MSRAAGRRVSIGAAGLILVGCSFLVESSDLSSVPPGPVTDAGSGPDRSAVANEAGGGDASTRDVIVLADADAAREPGLIGEWRFEDEGTVAKDTSGFGRDGLLKGFASMVGGGRSGAGLLLTGGSDAVLIDALANDAFPRTGSVSLWFKQAIPDSSTGSIGVFDNWDDTRDHVFLRRPNDVGQTFQISFQRGDASPYPVSVNFDSPPNKWTHVTMTWEEAASIGVAYVDGLEQKRSSYYGGAFAPVRQIARLGNGFAGMIDEVRLYDRVLSPQEVLSLSQ